MLRVHYYDGRTTRRHAARLAARDGRVAVSGEGFARDAALADLEVSEPLAGAPRTLRFANGAFCEVDDTPELAQLLAAAGHRDSWVVRWQASWRWALASLLVIAGALVALYLRGLPWAAARAAERMPPEFAQALTERALESLEEDLLQPSTLAPARIEGLRARFAALRAASPGQEQATLLFRSAPRVGANAFALPDGRIVLLDELVVLADNDAQVGAVLAHELGHVHHRHGLRTLLQGTLVGLFSAWWFGDFSGFAAGAPSVLLQARYSRGFETDADAHAARLLRSVGAPPSLLADILERLAAQRGGSSGDKARWTDYLSSHPAPRERAQALRGERVGS